MRRAALVCALGGLLPACGDSVNACASDFSAQPKLSEIQTRVFNRSCAFTDCHGDTRTQPMNGPSMNLSVGKAYASLTEVATGKPSAKRVEPRNPDGSFLIEKLTSDMPADNGSRMPKNAAPLCDAEIEAIKTWIRLGAANN